MKGPTPKMGTGTGKAPFSPAPVDRGPGSSPRGDTTMPSECQGTAGDRAKPGC